MKRSKRYIIYLVPPACFSFFTISSPAAQTRITPYTHPYTRTYFVPRQLPAYFNTADFIVFIIILHTCDSCSTTIIIITLCCAGQVVVVYPARATV